MWQHWNSRSRSSAKAAGGGWRETIKIVIQALILATVVRTFFYEPFSIPSGSMKDTLLVGDYLFTSKLSYGYSRYSFPWGLISFNGRIFGAEPKRGDVVVFKLPRDDSIHFIKRVIGLPGDEIEVQNAIVSINGQPALQKRAGEYIGPEENWRPKPRYEETLPNGLKHYVLHWEQEGDLDNVGPFKVPAGNYFMMGDNRDDSIDSRVSSLGNGVGFVPFQNLVGRAEIIFFSAATDDPHAFRLTTPWTWPFDIRWARFFGLIR
jgi:signal peptidase I